MQNFHSEDGGLTVSFFHRVKTSYLVPILLASALVVCAPTDAFSSLSVKEEREMGRKIYEMIKKNMTIADDPAVNAYISSLGNKLVRVIGSQPFDFHFYVIEANDVNAFATPGGYIYVFSGLIGTMNAEGQLASIICHELGHVTSRHISKQIEKSKGLTVASVAGVVAGALLGGPIGSAVALGSMAGGSQAQLAYSREDEREADAKGLEYLALAGYDPRYMAQTFKLFMRNSWRIPKNAASYLSTHPGSPARLAAVENAIIINPELASVLGRGDDDAFNAVKNRLIAQTNDPRNAKKHFEALIKKNYNNAWAHHGLAMIYQKEQNLDAAVKEFKLALEMEPANSGFLTDLGYTLFLKKDFQSALEVLSRALVLKPQSVQTLYHLARTYEELEVLDRARDLYERVVLLDPDHLDSLYRLGVIYGQRGDLARAHLFSGLFFEQKEQIRQALFHMRRAKSESVSAPPEVRTRIDKELAELEEKEKENPRRFGGGK
jgi:predicted Zn-dependent protease